MKYRINLSRIKFRTIILVSIASVFLFSVILPTVGTQAQKTFAKKNSEYTLNSSLDRPSRWILFKIALRESAKGERLKLVDQKLLREMKRNLVDQLGECKEPKCLSGFIDEIEEIDGVKFIKNRKYCRECASTGANVTGNKGYESKLWDELMKEVDPGYRDEFRRGFGKDLKSILAFGVVGNVIIDYSPATPSEVLNRFNIAKSASDPTISDNILLSSRNKCKLIKKKPTTKARSLVRASVNAHINYARRVTHIGANYLDGTDAEKRNIINKIKRVPVPKKAKKQHIARLDRAFNGQKRHRLVCPNKITLRPIDDQGKPVEGLKLATIKLRRTVHR